MTWLAKCPKCGHKRYDTTAEACERRQCGYVKPRDSGERGDAEMRQMGMVLAALAADQGSEADVAGSGNSPMYAEAEGRPGRGATGNVSADQGGEE